MNLKYFEDISEGFAWVTLKRTITESDIVNFAGLSGDFNPLHMDQEFAKQTLFGQRIAHGLLGLSITSGLQAMDAPWKIMAFMGLEWKFSKPIFIGDTVFCKSTVTQKRELGKEKGIVKLDRQLLNQREEITQQGTFTLLVERRVNS